MVRWIRVAAIGALVLSLVVLGIGIGLFLVANSGWVPVTVPPWLVSLFGNPELELWVPGLIAGWLVSVFAVAGLLVLSVFYVWRRRQYEALIRRLERSLAELRNLPFTAPAPLEDLPEEPNSETAKVLAFADQRALPAAGESDE